MKTKPSKTLDTVSHFPDRAVACPICDQEFWGFSEIIFCSCGWTYIKEDEAPRVNLKVLRDAELSGKYLRFKDLAPARLEKN